MRCTLALAAVAIVGCGPEPDRGSDAGPAAAQDGGPEVASDSGPSDAGAEDAGAADSGPGGGGMIDSGPGDSGPLDGGCPPGAPCNPIVIDSTPFTDLRNTMEAPSDAASAYACAPATDESGGEFYYVVDILERSKLVAALDDASGDAVDVDVHLLQTTDPVTCLARNNVSFSRQLEPGTYFLVADTWVNGSGVALAGPYRLTVTVEALPGGRCAMAPLDVKMYWTSCAPGIDCLESGGERWLRTPGAGPVAKEAHLVTVAESFSGGWPTSFTDQIDRHYSVSQAATGYAMTRAEPWAPAGEGGSQYGQGATGARLPVVEEGWYVNMYWKIRPAPGTRMLVMNPASGKAVVAAGGYETGPGSNTAIGGASEEIHHYLGTSHRGTLVMGFAADQATDLGYGPIACQ